VINSVFVSEREIKHPNLRRRRRRRRKKKKKKKKKKTIKCFKF
jgi:hypothetical protein